MTMRLFFFFLSFRYTTVVRWPFLHATRMQPSDRRAESAHPHTQQHTLLHTHTFSHTQATKGLIAFGWFCCLCLFPHFHLQPWPLCPSLCGEHGKAVASSSCHRCCLLFYPFAIMLFKMLWCVAVHGISMLLGGGGYLMRR